MVLPELPNQLFPALLHSLHLGFGVASALSFSLVVGRSLALHFLFQTLARVVFRIRSAEMSVEYGASRVAKSVILYFLPALDYIAIPNSSTGCCWDREGVQK